MARTKLSGGQLSDNSVSTDIIADSSVRRLDLNVTAAGQAVIAKIIEGAGIAINSTGVDAGTGDVTVSLRAATASVLGGIKVGAGLAIDGNGVLSTIFAEADTLETVTSRGATSSNAITLNALLTANAGISATTITTSADSTFYGVRVGRGAGNVVSNVVVGYSSLEANTTGTENTIIGSWSYRSNILGIKNTAVGYGNMPGNTTGSNNTVVGNQNMWSATGGSFNTVVGVNNLSNNTTGLYNTVMGYGNMINNTVGVFNVAIGNSVLVSNTNGSENVGIGKQALNVNTSGNRNVALGWYALGRNTSGSDNFASGENALQNNTTGQRNIAIGVNAAGTNTTGSNNIVLGSDISLPSAIQSNSLLIATGGVAKIYSPSTHNIILGGIVDDTVNKLQVTGSGIFTGNVTAPSFVGNFTGNASTATALQTGRAINGVTFDGTSNITITAAAGTLTGTTLNATIVTSSLTSVGTITSGVWQGTAIGDSYISSASTWNAKISGTGTTGYLQKTTSSGVIGNSIVSESGGIINIAGKLNLSGLLGELLTVNGVAGEWGVNIKGNSLANNSYGLLISAGTSVSDFALGIFNQALSSSLLTIRGNGQLITQGASNTGEAHIFGGSARVNGALTTTLDATINGVRIGRDFSITNRATVRLDANGDAPADILFGKTAAANEAGWTGVFWGLSSRASNESNEFRLYRGNANTGGSELLVVAFNVNGGVTFVNNVYATDYYANSGWFRNSSSNTGLYNQTNANHFYSKSDRSWGITAGNQSDGALNFYRDHETTFEGAVYFDTSGFGLLNRARNWAVRSDINSTHLRLYYNGIEKLRTEGGGISIFGHASTTGYVSAGNGRLTMGILDLNSGDSPAQIRINTKIPFASGSADFTVNIKGFKYDTGNTVSLALSWHYYLDQFWNRNAISNGSWQPTITLARDAAGFVVIHLSTPGYWPKLYVESMYSSAYADAYAEGWTFTDADLSDCTSVQTVPYKALSTDILGTAAIAKRVYLGGDSAMMITDSAWAGTGGYPGYSYSGGNSRFGFSSSSGVVDVYADGNFYATDNAYLVLHTGNFNSYAPTLTGTGASGSWNISITGNADTVDNYHAISFVKQAYVNVGYDWNTIEAENSDTAAVFRLESSVLNPPANDVYNWSLWQQGTRNRGSQIAVSAYGTTRMFFRGANNDSSTYRSWVEVIHSGNIGSQSVNYATSSGSATTATNANYATNAGNASTLGGRTSAQFQPVYNTTLNLSALNDATYYPVTIPINSGRVTRMRIQNTLNSNVPSWSSHPSGFSIRLDWSSNGNGWGTIPIQRTVHNYVEGFAYVQICGGLTDMGHSSQEVVWLRGGGIYYFEADADVSPTIQTTTYTYLTQTVDPQTSVINNIYSSANGYIGTNISGNAETVTNGVYTSGFYSNPAWITSLAWSKISSTPTTVSGYGITDAITTGNIGSQSVNYAITSGTATTANGINGFLAVLAASIQSATISSIIAVDTNGSIYRYNLSALQSFGVITTSNINSQSVNYATTAGALTSMNISQFTNNSGYLTAETDTLATVTSRGASTSNSITLTSANNYFNGHHYFIAHDDNGNHYPHYNNGANNNGSKMNLRMIDASGNVVLFYLNGNTKEISWNGYNVWNAGNDGAGTGLDADLLDGQHGSYYATSVHTHGLGRHSLRATSNIDAMTTANFRTVAFDVLDTAWHISTARWNNVPTALSGHSQYGTMIAWAGSDTHGFLALDYSTAYASVGGGYGDFITWRKTLAFGDGTGASGTWGINISGNAATATSADQIDGWAFRNTGSNTGVNADTLESNGITYYTGGVPNFTGNSTDGALYSQAYSADWQHQIAGDFRSGQIALRGKNNGTWQAWRTVLDSTNYTIYSPSLTGTGASGTWGINISGNAATASNLVNGGGVASASGSRYINIDSTDGWAFLRLSKAGTTIWDIAQENGGALEFRPAGIATNRFTMSSAGLFTAPSITTSLISNAADLNVTVTGVVNKLIFTSDNVIRFTSGSVNINLANVVGVTTFGPQVQASTTRLGSSTERWGFVFGMTINGTDVIAESAVYSYGMVVANYNQTNNNGFQINRNTSAANSRIWKLVSDTTAYGDLNLYGTDSVGSSTTYLYIDSVANLMDLGLGNATNVRFHRIQSVASTTMVTNLNADFLDGYHSSAFYLKAASGITVGDGSAALVGVSLSGLSGVIDLTNDSGTFKVTVQGFSPNILAAGNTVTIQDNSVNSAVLKTNTLTTYGAWYMSGVRGAYTGIAYEGSNKPHVMFASATGSGGFYYETLSRWVFYHDTANNRTSIGGTANTAGYEVQINGAARVTTNLLVSGNSILSGSISANTTNLRANLTGAQSIAAADFIVEHTGGAATYTLPTAASSTGRIICIINHGSGAITTSIAYRTANATTSTSIAIASRVILVSDGAEWLLLGT